MHDPRGAEPCGEGKILHCVRIPRHRDHLFHQYDRSFQIDRDR